MTPFSYEALKKVKFSLWGGKSKQGIKKFCRNQEVDVMHVSYEV